MGHFYFELYHRKSTITKEEYGAYSVLLATERIMSQDINPNEVRHSGARR